MNRWAENDKLNDLVNRAKAARRGPSLADIDSIKTCACCGNFVISDDDEIAAQELCDRCHAEINAPDDIIGWGKGE